MATIFDANFTAYKVWPALAPVGSGVNASWAVEAVGLEMAASSNVADVNLSVFNYDDQSVSMTVEIESSYGAALFNNVWGAASSSGGGGATNLSTSRTSTAVTISSDTGTDATIPAASDTQAGVLTAAMKSKLDGIEAGAQVNPTGAAIVSAIDTELGGSGWQAGGGSIVLDAVPDADSVVLEVGGTPAADILAATATEAGVMSAADKTKLNGIEAGAEANYTEAELIAILGEPVGAKGTVLVPPTVAISSNGTTVTATVGAATVQFSSGSLSYAGSAVSLTAGSNTAPTTNYVYIQQSDSALHASTSGWPVAEHAPIAVVLVQGAASVQSEGPYNLVVMDAYTQGASAAADGKFVELVKASKLSAEWVSGMGLTTTITANGSDDDDIDLVIASGTFNRGRAVAFPGRDSTGSDQIYLYNSSAAAYTKVGTLKTALKTNSLGGAIVAGQYASLFVWAAVSETGSVSKIMANLPSAFYPSEKSAIADSGAYTKYDVPASLRASCIPVARVILLYTAAGGGSWTLVYTQDLRGKSISQLENGVPASSEVLDSEFKIRDDADPTKVVEFQVSDVSTGTTITLTAPDASGTFSLLEVAQAFSAGAKKSFSHSATTAGLRIVPVDGDPSSPADGDIWYNSSTNKFRKRQNGVTEDLDTQGSAAPGGSDNEFTYNNGGAFGGSSGFIYNETSSRAKAVNGLELPQLSSPSTPATDTMVIFAKARANRSLPAFVDEYGTEFTMGPSQGRIVQGYWKPNGQNTTPATYVFGSSVTGTASVATLASGGFARRLRLNFATASAATNTHSGVRGGTNFIARVSGFYYRVIWGVSGTLNTASRGFFGFTTSSALISGSTEPSAYTNVFGIGWDASQTELRAIYNDGSGAANTSSLGVNFPINGSVNDDIYDCELYCDPANTTDVFYQVTRTKTSTGDTYVATGTMSTDLPASTTTGNFHAHINSGSAAAVTTVAIFSQYFETGW